MPRQLLFLLVLLSLHSAFVIAKVVTVRNDVLRVDVDGNVIDCHSGNIVAHDGVFYMYGEHYGNTTGTMLFRTTSPRSPR